MTFGISAGTLLTAGTSLIGGLMGSNAASSAVDSQAASTAEANKIAKEQNAQVRSDLAPYRTYGNASANRLMQMLGLDGNAGGPATGTMAANGSMPQDANAIRAELLPQFTTRGQAGWSPETQSESGEDFGGISPFMGPQATAATPDTIDEAGLQAAIQARMNQQTFTPTNNVQAGMQSNAPTNNVQAGMQSNALADAQSRGDYGSLLQDFTGADLVNEPGYQFQLAEGQKALDRKAAQGGSYFSGGALKAASRYGTDYAGTKYGEAFNRDAAQKTQKYNFLSGGVGVGQNAAAQTGNAGSTMAQQVGANTTALGNAQGASAIAGSNAWSNAFNNGVGAYNQNQLLDKITRGNTGWGGPSNQADGFYR